MPEIREINLDLLLEPPITQRAVMDETALDDLTHSIKQWGVLQNLIVVPDGEKYEIVAGHRRSICARRAGKVHVPCMIFENIGDAKYAVMLTENGLRQDVTAAEEGMFFLDLAEKRGWSEQQICDYVDRSADYVNTRAKLVRDFPEVTQAVTERAINWSQAKAIMRCKIPRWIPYLIEQAKTHGANAKSLAYMVDQLKIQESLGTSQTAPANQADAPVFLEPAKEKCTWCQRDDDQANMTTLPIHRYHARDLSAFLTATGVMSSPPAPTAPGKPGA